jgi:hypothetical protein
MKKKLIQALRTSYADKGLNQSELEELANILSQNLNEEASEDEISNAVSGVSAYVSIMQKFGNRCASAIENKYKGYVKPEVKPNGDEGEQQQAITREQIAEMLQTGIAEAMRPYQEAENKKRLAAILCSQPNLKDVPAKFINRYTLSDEDGAEALASQIEQDYAEERKTILESIGLADVPQYGSGKSDDDFVQLMKNAQKVLAPKA